VCVCSVHVGKILVMLASIIFVWTLSFFRHVEHELPADLAVGTIKFSPTGTLGDSQLAVIGLALTFLEASLLLAEAGFTARTIAALEAVPGPASVFDAVQMPTGPSTAGNGSLAVNATLGSGSAGGVVSLARVPAWDRRMLDAARRRNSVADDRSSGGGTFSLQVQSRNRRQRLREAKLMKLDNSTVENDSVSASDDGM
jgi:hypothetical protein